MGKENMCEGVGKGEVGLPTCRHARGAYCLAKLHIQTGVVETICSIYKQIPRMIATQKVVHDLLAGVCGVPRCIAVKGTGFCVP